MNEGALQCPSAWVGTGNVYRKMIGEKFQARFIVDIGIDWGYSMFKLALDFPKAFVIGIDNFSYHVNEQKREAMNHLLAWSSVFDNLCIIAGKSQAIATKVKRLAVGAIDILSIDGDHSYDGVKGDFDAWIPHLRRGGVVLFHDTQHYDNECGVPRFFKELKGRKLEDPAGGPGLGVWFND